MIEDPLSQPLQQQGGAVGPLSGMNSGSQTGGSANLPAKTVAQIQRTDKELDEVMRASAGRNIKVADFDRAASALSVKEETALKAIEAPPLSTSGLDGSEHYMRFRELKGLDKAMQTQRGQLVNNLEKIAEKVQAAIPGIIGSVVSWLLSTAGKAVGWLAEHTWALLFAIGGLLLVAAQEWLAKRKPKGNQP